MRAIALTHGHYDHAQNAAFLSNELNVPIVMSEKDLPLIQDNCAEAMQADTAIGRAVLSVSQRGFESETIEDFRPAKFLEEGTTLVDFGFPDIYVIELPGHTKGSIGFVRGASGHPALFVGDALMNLVYPSSAMFYGNGEDARTSAQRIASFGEATIHFGHGRSLPNKENCKKRRRPPWTGESTEPTAAPDKCTGTGSRAPNSATRVTIHRTRKAFRTQRVRQRTAFDTRYSVAASPR